VVGNNNGLAGFMVTQGKEAKSALTKARNSASQRLRFVERDLSSNTIVHDFVSQYGATKVYAYKKPNGYGVVAHRCIKSICDVIGIDNIYCKVEGPVKNYLNVTKAFFLGLCEQKSFQALADEKQLHVVEMREENDYFPKIVASPSNGFVRSPHEIGPDEITDFRMYLNNGEVIDVQPHQYPQWVRTQGFVKYLKIWQTVKRNRQESRVYLKAKYGQLDSFLTVREKEERAQRKTALALQQDQPKEERTTTEET
jgi:small subunit ribosomal protein S5